LCPNAKFALQDEHELAFVTLSVLSFKTIAVERTAMPMPTVMKIAEIAVYIQLIPAIV
jgi:hypothetical protein